MFSSVFFCISTKSSKNYHKLKICSKSHKTLKFYKLWCYLAQAVQKIQLLWTSKSDLLFNGQGLNFTGLLALWGLRKNILKCPQHMLFDTNKKVTQHRIFYELLRSSCAHFIPPGKLAASFYKAFPIKLCASSRKLTLH